MRQEFRLADIGEGLEEAEIVRWLVEVGEVVERDQPLVEVMTDKSNAELPAPWSGTVVLLGGAIGDVVEVGHVLAVIDHDGAGASEAAASLDRPDAGAGASEAAASLDRPDAGAALGAFQRETQPSAGPSQGPPPEAGISPPPSQPQPPPPPPPPSPRSAPPVHPAPPSGPEPTPAALRGDAGAARPKASPSTRREAARRGIDLSQVAGSGPGGRILLTDLDSSPSPGGGPRQPRPTDPRLSGGVADTRSWPAPAPMPEDPDLGPVVATTAPSPASAAPTAPGHGSANDRVPAPAPGVQPLRGIRRAIAHNMARSWSEIPHIHATEHIDAEPFLEFRARLRASDNPALKDLTPLSILVAAVASALRRFPQANTAIDMAAQTLTVHKRINVGIAVAAPQGLVVPVIADAGTRDLAAIATEVRRLVDGARSGGLDRAEFSGGTTTITNFGALGGEQAFPLIRAPEATIFGFGSIAKRPYVLDDAVVARSTMNLVIGADHRLLDGDVTTSLLHHVAEMLANPVRLLVEV